MNEGLLQQVGTPQVLYDTPINRFVAGFIGSPSMNFVEVHMEGTGEGARLVGPADWSIPIPVRYREAATPKAGKTLVAGFRPEHLDIGDAGSSVASFRARADVVEYLGNEELLHVNAANQDVVAIVDSAHRVRPGDIVSLVIWVFRFWRPAIAPPIVTDRMEPFTERRPDIVPHTRIHYAIMQQDNCL
jgi:multiple sugar transport system ATP-binding protein